MKYTFTDKRKITVRGQHLSSGGWTIVISSKGKDIWVFNTKIPNKEHAKTLLNKVLSTKHIQTQYWVKM